MGGKGGVGARKIANEKRRGWVKFYHKIVD